MKTIRHNQLKSAYWSFSQYCTWCLMLACSIIMCVIWYYLRISHWTNTSLCSVYVFFLSSFSHKGHLIALRYALLRVRFDWVCVSNWTLAVNVLGHSNILRLLVSITSGIHSFKWQDGNHWTVKIRWNEWQTKSHFQSMWMDCRALSRIKIAILVKANHKVAVNRRRKKKSQHRIKLLNGGHHVEVNNWCPAYNTG